MAGEHTNRVALEEEEEEAGAEEGKQEEEAAELCCGAVRCVVLCCVCLRPPGRCLEPMDPIGIHWNPTFLKSCSRPGSIAHFSDSGGIQVLNSQQ